MSNTKEKIQQLQNTLKAFIEKTKNKQIDAVKKLNNLSDALSKILPLLNVEGCNTVTNDQWIEDLYQDFICEIIEDIENIPTRPNEKIKSKVLDMLPKLRRLIFVLLDIAQTNKAYSCCRLDDELTQLQQQSNVTVGNITEASKKCSEEEKKIEQNNIKVKELYDQVTQYSNESKDLLTNAKNTSETVEALHKTAEQHVKRSKDTLNELTQKAESLAPSLAAAELAERHNKYAKEYEKQSRNLFLSTVVVGVFSAILIYIAIFYSPAAKELVKSGSYFAWGVESLIKITLSAFLIYVTVFISRIYNRSRNLMEEYRHKSAISDSYTGLMKYLQQQKEEEENNPEVLKEIKSAIAELANVYIEQLAVSPGEVHVTHSLKKDSNFTSLIFNKINARINKGNMEMDAQS